MSHRSVQRAFEDGSIYNTGLWFILLFVVTIICFIIGFASNFFVAILIWIFYFFASIYTFFK